MDYPVAPAQYEYCGWEILQDLLVASMIKPASLRPKARPASIEIRKVCARFLQLIEVSFIQKEKLFRHLEMGSEVGTDHRPLGLLRLPQNEIAR
jgi:hypothetical protein